MSSLLSFAISESFSWRTVCSEDFSSSPGSQLAQASVVGLDELTFIGFLFETLEVLVHEIAERVAVVGSQLLHGGKAARGGVG